MGGLPLRFWSCKGGAFLALPCYLGDHDAFLKFRVAANVAVRGVTQAGRQDVLAIETAFAQVLREGGGWLVINDEFHDAGSTAWSV